MRKLVAEEAVVVAEGVAVVAEGVAVAAVVAVGKIYKQSHNL